MNKWKSFKLNQKAKNILHNAISDEEYKKISYCETDKKTWDKLEVTYTETEKDKQTLISLLFYEYELF